MVVVAAIAIGAVTRNSGIAPVNVTTAPAPTEGRVKGSATAPVVLVEFADYQCPSCARQALTTERLLEERYIADGTVRLEVRQFPILGRESVRADEASECAGEQGKFWVYRDALYANQNGANRGAFSDKNLRRIAERVGLDGGALAACLDSGRYAERLRNDLEAGRALGVNGTPTVFVNGAMIVGAQPLAVFEAAIAEALRQAGR